MTTVQKMIEVLQTLPPQWNLHMDSVGHVCISDDAQRIVGYLDIATGEIERWDDSVSP